MATIEVHSDIARRDVYASVTDAPDLSRYGFTIRPHSIIVRFESDEVVKVTVTGLRVFSCGRLGDPTAIEYGVGNWPRHKLADAPDWVHEAVRSLPLSDGPASRGANRAVELHRPIGYDMYAYPVTDPAKMEVWVWRCNACVRRVGPEGCETWQTASGAAK
jgi:hypothetical protein